MTNTQTTPHPASVRTGETLRRLLIGALIVAALVAAARLGGAYVETFRTQVAGLGIWGPVVFILSAWFAALPIANSLGSTDGRPLTPPHGPSGVSSTVQGFGCFCCQ